MTREERLKTCWIVAGPNGAGKSTLAAKYLPRNCAAYINADNIVRENGLDGSTAAGLIKSGRLFRDRLDGVMRENRSFALETTLSGRTHLNTVKRLRANGWRVELHYIYIPNVAFSAERVRIRVQDGGHDVPLDDITRRYARSVGNVKAYSALCDYTACYDNSNAMPRFVFIRNGQDDPWIVDQTIYDLVMSGQARGGMESDELAGRALRNFKDAVMENLKRKSKVGGSVVIADWQDNPVVVPARTVLASVGLAEDVIKSTIS